MCFSKVEGVHKCVSDAGREQARKPCVGKPKTQTARRQWRGVPSSRIGVNQGHRRVVMGNLADRVGPKKRFIREANSLQKHLLSDSGDVSPTD